MARTKKNAPSPSVKVRMYRQGLGDCFLIALPRTNGTPYYILIDCGVVLGTADAAQKMKEVVSNIIRTTDGHVHLLVATHEHWDHLSGFVQANDLFSALKVDEVWLAWTEDPEDALANQLRTQHQALRQALASACARMQMAGGRANDTAESLLEFFGAAGQGGTGDALKIVKHFCRQPRYCRPADQPIEIADAGARLYILGPPHDEKAIKRFSPLKSKPETYGLAEMYLDTADRDAPFDPIVQIPIDAARQMPFFANRYWGEGDSDGAEKDQSWRRIDGDWLDSSSSLALQLDSATNNTSLVLAIELEDGRVLLFVGDAQVGSWLSWQDLSWGDVTAPDLLHRTILYKVGHHGSHNATLREKGLELMKNLEIALIPVDHDMAVKKHWGKMPLDDLEKTLNQATGNRVLRVDREIPAELEGRVDQDPDKRLYYEVLV